MLLETARRALTRRNIKWLLTRPENHFKWNQICFYFNLGKVFQSPEFQAKLFFKRIWVGGFLERQPLKNLKLHKECIFRHPELLQFLKDNIFLNIAPKKLKVHHVLSLTSALAAWPSYLYLTRFLLYAKPYAIQQNHSCPHKSLYSEGETIYEREAFSDCGVASFMYTIRTVVIKGSYHTNFNAILRGWDRESLIVSTHELKRS